MSASSSNELNAVLNKVTAGDVIIWKNGSYKNEKISFAPKLNGKKDLPVNSRQTDPLPPFQIDPSKTDFIISRFRPKNCTKSLLFSMNKNNTKFLSSCFK